MGLVPSSDYTGPNWSAYKSCIIDICHDGRTFNTSIGAPGYVNPAKEACPNAKIAERCYAVYGNFWDSFNACMT